MKAGVAIAARSAGLSERTAYNGWLAIERATLRWWSSTAKAEWKRLAGEVHRLGIVSQLDRAALAYCQAYGRWAEAEKKLPSGSCTNWWATSGST